MAKGKSVVNLERSEFDFPVDQLFINDDSFDDETDHDIDEKLTIRNNFPETFLWDLVDVDGFVLFNFLV